MYMKAINELKREISSFQNKDITELLTFHQYIESLLEKLTDEAKVSDYNNNKQRVIVTSLLHHVIIIL